MKQVYSYLVFVATLAGGCELFTVGKSSSQTQEVERSQRTSAGVVHLWKSEIDSANVTAAAELMRSKTGKPLLAVERYEMSDGFKRWIKIIGGKPITSTTTDTVSAQQHTVRIAVDYIRTVKFETRNLGDKWFIVSVE